MRVGKLPIPEAKKLLNELVILLPRKYNIKWPEGNIKLQAEGIVNFITQYFRNISPSEIEKAMELNDARRFENFVDHYNKWTREFLGNLLTEYRKWRAANTQQGTQFSKEVSSIPDKLLEDARLLKFYDDAYHITRFVDEKYEYLKTLDDFKAPKDDPDWQGKSDMIREFLKSKI